MTPSDLLKQAVAFFEKQSCQYALAGGWAASLYRKDIRATDDVDLLLFSDIEVTHLIEPLLRELHYRLLTTRMAQLKMAPGMNKKSSPPAILTGVPRSKEDPKLDFLLSAFPWFHKALQRAQHNRIDFGFGQIPTLTLEDVILSKLNAFQNNSSRFKDLDDLQSIFQSGHKMDLDYLLSEKERLQLDMPQLLSPQLPPSLRKLFSFNKKSGLRLPERT